MALKLYSGKSQALKVYASDWKVFAKELAKVDRTQSIQLKKRFKEIAQEAQTSVKQELKGLGTDGPMKGMRHGGRTGWGRNYGSIGSPVSGATRYPFDSVFIEAFNKPKRNQTGIARLRVRSAGTVIGDLAMKSRGERTTRMYKIREFGGPEISRTHRVKTDAVGEMLRKLGGISKPSKRKKSRNVYPGFDKSYPKVKAQAEIAIQAAVKIIDSQIERNN